MVRRMDNVGIVLEDLDVAIGFFTELGLELEGRAPIEGAWADRVTGLRDMRLSVHPQPTPNPESPMPRLRLPRSYRIASPARALRMARVGVLIGAASALAIGCASGDQEDGASDTAAVAGAVATSSAPAASEGAENGTVHLEVTGGPHAGSYDARMTSGGCSHGYAGAGAWGNQYSIDASDPKAFSSLQLIVPDTKAAASGTSAFKMTASFGPMFGAGGKSYDIDTRADASRKMGSGQVTIDDRGTTGRVTFDGTTADGIGLKGTIDCRKVMRAG